MKMSRWTLGVVFVGVSVAFMAIVPDADAAGPSAKVKCRVGNPPRVQIAVGANGLAPGTADFAVIASNGNVSSILTDAVDVLGDAAAEWDSAIAVGDPAEGVRGPIDANFVVVGDKVNAFVAQGGVVVATASTGCGKK